MSEVFTTIVNNAVHYVGGRDRRYFRYEMLLLLEHLPSFRALCKQLDLIKFVILSFCIFFSQCADTEVTNIKQSNTFYKNL